MLFALRVALLGVFTLPRRTLFHPFPLSVPVLPRVPNCRIRLWTTWTRLEDPPLSSEGDGMTRRAWLSCVFAQGVPHLFTDGCTHVL